MLAVTSLNVFSVSEIVKKLYLGSEDKSLYFSDNSPGGPFVSMEGVWESLPNQVKDDFP